MPQQTIQNPDGSVTVITFDGRGKEESRVTRTPDGGVVRQDSNPVTNEPGEKVKRIGAFEAPKSFAKSGNTLNLTPAIDPGGLGMPTYQDPGSLKIGSYVGGKESASFARNIAKGLGISPVDTSAEIEAAGRTALNRDAHAQAVADADAMAMRGLGDSGTALALGSRRGIDYAAADADLSMKAKMDAADRKMQVDALLAGLAGEYSQGKSQFKLNKANILGDYKLGRADAKNSFGLDSARTLGDYNLGRAGQLNDATFQRETTEHGANVMFPISIKAAQNAANKAKNAAIASGMLSFAGGLGGGLIGLCWVADELWGPDDQRTQDARLYANSVNTPFTRAYRTHGRKWADWIRNDEVARRMLAPIWEQMADEGAKMRTTGV